MLPAVDPLPGPLLLRRVWKALALRALLQERLFPGKPAQKQRHSFAPKEPEAVLSRSWDLGGRVPPGSLGGDSGTCLHHLPCPP